jgi:hypothetical protein
LAKNLGRNLCYCDVKVKAYTGASLAPLSRGKYDAEKFKGMAMAKTAFVTGGTGFVGLNLIDELIKQGWAVTALHRPSSDLT